MKTEDVIKLIGQRCTSNHCKVYFGERDQRTPMIGRFVALKDGIELQRKGMVRFIPMSKDEFWTDIPPVAMTKIFVVKDFTQIKPV